MVSVLQSTESKSRQIPKFAREQGPALQAAWVRPSGIAEECAFSRSCPGGLPSYRPPVCCLGLRALPGREPAPRRTPGTSGASGRPALRSGRPTVLVRPGPCAPLVGSHPAAAVSRSLPEQRRRLARGLRFGRRTRGRAPEAGGDSGNVPGAVRPGKSLQVRGLGGRRRSVSLPGPETSAPRGTSCTRAPPGQLSASRKGHGTGVRGITPSRCFPLAQRCGHTDARRHPASPTDPHSPDSQTCVLSPERARPWCPRTGCTGRDHGPPFRQRAPGSASSQCWETAVPLPSR
ncbi:unnamed protein product [Rangifer tarandus platyrhynchus]|uniref:Uncharacterized protein n=2 Tax=Rangifer tarandus platyrhynchus TaxID=3082113 RepID=A0ABN9A0N4_RANTA|nr:unnamed protein product [Rangifer tarandus platyrhynchus]CAI9711940.1 unnamed protein product [Rangifer tarandus platyrhynchus]